jgi:integrase
MTFEEYANQWTRTVLPLSKPATIATVRSHLKTLNAGLGAQPLDVPYPVVQAIFTDLSLKHAPKTVRNIHSTYHNIMSAAVREGVITKVPKIALPKAARVEQDWLDLDSMKRIIRDSRPAHRTLYALLSETGLRIGEALGLQVRDVNVEAGTLEIKRSVYNGKVQAPKTEAAYRTLTLSTYLTDMLKDILSGNFEDFIFKSGAGTPLWPDKILLRDLQPLLKDLKLEPVGLHAFRRGNATLLCSVLGCPEKIAAHRLGHRAPGLTLGLYAQSFKGIDLEWAPRIGKAIFE